MVLAQPVIQAARESNGFPPIAKLKCVTTEMVGHWRTGVDLNLTRP